MRVKKEREPVRVICIDCGCEFSALSSKALRCPECKKKSRTEQSIRSREKSSHKIKLNRPKLTMREVLQRLEAYNKEHKTHLSYGKFVELMEGGKLDE